MGMSVSQCQAEIDSREFAEHAAYARLEPWDEERGDMRAAMIAYTMACAWYGKKGPRPKFDDFLLRFDRPARRRQSGAEMKAIFGLFAQGHNRNLKRRKRRKRRERS